MNELSERGADTVANDALMELFDANKKEQRTVADLINTQIRESGKGINIKQQLSDLSVDNITSFSADLKFRIEDNGNRLGEKNAIVKVYNAGTTDLVFTGELSQYERKLEISGLKKDTQYDYEIVVNGFITYTDEDTNTTGEIIVGTGTFTTTDEDIETA